jgi:hypothetical protein
MPSKKKQPTERTRTGHEVPIPKRSAFFSNLRKVAKVPGKGSSGHAARRAGKK